MSFYDACCHDSVVSFTFPFVLELYNGFADFNGINNLEISNDVTMGRVIYPYRRLKKVRQSTQIVLSQCRSTVNDHPPIAHFR